MSGLTIVIAGSDAERFHAALSLAAANAARGRRSRIFLQGEAVALLRGEPAPGDAERSRHGVPTVPQLLDEALALGVEIGACQSGMAVTGLRAVDLPTEIQTTGLVELLSGLGDDRLVVV